MRAFFGLRLSGVSASTTDFLFSATVPSTSVAALARDTKRIYKLTSVGHVRKIKSSQSNITLTVGLCLSVFAVDVVFGIFSTVGVLGAIAVLLGVFGFTALVAVVVRDVTRVLL